MASITAIFRNFQIAYGELENQFLEGLISDGERYNKVIDIWAQVNEEIAKCGLDLTVTPRRAAHVTNNT